MMFPHSASAYRLSPVQKGMLFQCLSAHDPSVYLGQLLCKLPHDVNLSAFKQAWQHVVERYEVLRTSFHWNGLDEPLQQVHNDVSLAMEIHDWRGSNSEKQEKELQAYLVADQKRGFDFSSAPLMRFTLFRLAKDEYLFLWTNHHILLDGRSRVIVLKECGWLYEQFCRNQQPQLPPVPSTRIMWNGSTATTWQEPGGTGSGSSVHFRHRGRWTFSVPTLQQTRRSTAESRFSFALMQSQGWTPSAHSMAPASIRWHKPHGRSAGAVQRRARHRLWRDPRIQAFSIQELRQRGRRAAEYASCTRQDRRRKVFQKNNLEMIRDQRNAMRSYEQTPLSEIRNWSGVSKNAQLFDTVVVFENRDLNSILAQENCALWKRGISRFSPGHFPLVLNGCSQPKLTFRIDFDRELVDDQLAERVALAPATPSGGSGPEPRSSCGRIVVHERRGAAAASGGLE